MLFALALMAGLILTGCASQQDENAGSGADADVSSNKISVTLQKEHLPADTTTGAEDTNKVAGQPSAEDRPVQPAGAPEKEPAAPVPAVQPSAPPKVAPPALPGKIYTIRVSSFLEVERAAVDQARLKKSLDEPIFIREADIKGRTWHRVCVGQFESMEAARQSAEQLKGKGLIKDYQIMRDRRS